MVKCVIAFLLMCSSAFGQVSELPPLRMVPLPDPIGNLSKDYPLNPTLECRNIWWYRMIVRGEWDRCDDRIDSILEEIENLKAFQKKVLADPDLDSEAKIMIIEAIFSNLGRLDVEKQLVEIRMVELEAEIHEYNQQWLLRGCGFYPSV